MVITAEEARQLAKGKFSKIYSKIEYYAKRGKNNFEYELHEDIDIEDLKQELESKGFKFYNFDNKIKVIWE